MCVADERVCASAFQHVCVCEKDRASVGVQEAWRRGGGVASKLQKKLIKNEKRERREGGREERGEGSGRKQPWVHRGGEREENKKKKRGRYGRRAAVFY